MSFFSRTCQIKRKELISGADLTRRRLLLCLAFSGSGDRRLARSDFYSLEASRLETGFEDEEKSLIITSICEIQDIEGKEVQEIRYTNICGRPERCRAAVT